MLALSSKLQIWWFHVLVVQSTEWVSDRSLQIPSPHPSSHKNTNLYTSTEKRENLAEFQAENFNAIKEELQFVEKHVWLYLTALQLVDFPHGDGIDVIFGGGRRKFLHQNQSDPEYSNKAGERLDGKDLIQQWLRKHSNSKYVWNQTEFDKIDPEKVDHVMGKYIKFILSILS